MKKIHGYTNKILNINLNDNIITTFSPNNDIYERFLGGIGLAAHILINELPPGTTPLSEDNIFSIMTGPITGSILPGSGRIEICALSPLTNIWGESSMGGFFGGFLKRAGFDGLLVRGKSETPKYIFINNETVLLEDAQWLWGKTTYETEYLLKQKYGKRSQVLSIGPAGENLVNFAGISHNYSNMAARCGLGAVLGSKQIKAIVVLGDSKVNVFNQAAVIEDRKEIIGYFDDDYVINILKNGGTAWGLDGLMQIDDVPVRNWSKKSSNFMNLSEKISGQAMDSAGLVGGRKSCFMCPIACKRLSTNKLDFTNDFGTIPEYESLGALGIMLLIDDKEALITANELCNLYGMDTISLGGTIAWAIDSYQKQLITSEDTGGIELVWGSSELLLSLIKLIAYQQGFGSLLAMGSKKASEIIGGDSGKFAIQVKGLELPMHDPDVNPGLGIVYATGPRGGSHNEKRNIDLNIDPKVQSLLIKNSVDRSLFESACIYCSYVTIPIPDELIVKTLTDITGFNFQVRSMYDIGSRIWLQRRLFNTYVCNLQANDDLPYRLLTSKESKEKFLGNLSIYYRTRKLSKSGSILPETLSSLSMDDYIKFLR